MADIYGVDEQTLAHLEPHQLAKLVLAQFKDAKNNEVVRGNLTNPYTFSAEYGPRYRAREPERVVHLLMEGFHWLDRNHYIMPCPGNEKTSTWTLTRKGHEADLSLDTVPSADFPAQLLHPEIESEAYTTFVQGKFDLAISAAFRHLEIRVRAVAGFGAEKIGRALMQAAFSSKTGPLAIPREDPNEQTAEMQLFDAAIGYYRNPSTHREVYRDAARAFQALLFASQLLGIVDDRANKLLGAMQ